jgi:hypothetical protein
MRERRYRPAHSVGARARTTPYSEGGQRRGRPCTLSIPLPISDLSKGMERLWSLAGATGGNRSQKATLAIFLER